MQYKFPWRAIALCVVAACAGLPAGWAQESIVAIASTASAAGCEGRPLRGVPGSPSAWTLAGAGGVLALGKMNVNLDGYGRAYHPRNAAAGAALHLCNAGSVYLPGGVFYHGSIDNPTCTGRFMDDVARIRDAGWASPSVGVVRWYGVLAEGSATMEGKTIKGVRPVLQPDGSGFYVSPTALFDRSIADEKVQSRYVNPLRVAAGVVPASLAQSHGVALGSFGVALNPRHGFAVPFVVGDQGPAVGEGSLALVRRVAGLPAMAPEDLNRNNRYAGVVGQREVLWVFFGDAPRPFDSRDEAATAQAAQAAFAQWGGVERLSQCARLAVAVGAAGAGASAAGRGR